LLLLLLLLNHTTKLWCSCRIVFQHHKTADLWCMHFLRLQATTAASLNSPAGRTVRPSTANSTCTGDDTALPLPGVTKLTPSAKAGDAASKPAHVRTQQLRPATEHVRSEAL
jgi:hypothetical protein